jgi:hypothetical protein
MNCLAVHVNVVVECSEGGGTRVILIRRTQMVSVL